MKIRWFAILFFVAATFAPAHSNDRQPQMAQNKALAKLAAWVIEQTSVSRQAEFFVVLSDQADLSGSAVLKSKSEKGEFVYQTLLQKARETQGPIIQWLDSRGIAHRSFYIVNAILVTGDRGVAMELAARPEVGRIEGNPQIQNLPQPMPEIESEAAIRASEVEDNIRYTGAPEVWAQGFTGQTAVIGGADTGFLWNHETLRSQYRGTNGAGKAKHNFNWHDSIHSGGGACGANSGAPCDDLGHGTHTMGTAVGNDGGVNQIGMAPGAKWIGCRNMDQNKGSPATYMECFEFFLAPYRVDGTPAEGQPSKAPDVTVNSWTCPPSEGCSALTLQAAVEAQRAAGIVTVIAAGNFAPQCSSIVSPPSLYDAAYTVGAFDHRTGAIALFSGQGPITIDGSNRRKPDITAPGVRVRSGTNAGATDYASLSGTSMATPHVAGAVALLLSARPDLRANVSELEGYLNDTATPVQSSPCGGDGVPNNTWGYGRLNAKAAIDLALTTILPTNSPLSANGGTGAVNVKAPEGTSWKAVSNDSWIVISSGSSGTGSGVVSYDVAQNIGQNVRVGTITIARRIFSLVQAGAGSGPCAFSISPTSRTVPAGGLSASVDVATGQGCAWSAGSNTSWITVVSGGGVGAGTVTYLVDANPGPVRRGTITIAGQIFSIKQKGS